MTAVKLVSRVLYRYQLQLYIGSVLKQVDTHLNYTVTQKCRMRTYTRCVCILCLCDKGKVLVMFFYCFRCVLLFHIPYSTLFHKRFPFFIPHSQVKVWFEWMSCVCMARLLRNSLLSVLFYFFFHSFFAFIACIASLCCLMLRLDFQN